MTAVASSDASTRKAGKLIRQLFSESVPEPSAVGGRVTRPTGFALGAWAQVDELGDGRRRFIVVWQETSSLYKLVLRRFASADAQAELEQVTATARKISNDWDPLP